MIAHFISIFFAFGYINSAFRVTHTLAVQVIELITLRLFVLNAIYRCGIFRVECRPFTKETYGMSGSIGSHL